MFANTSHSDDGAGVVWLSTIVDSNVTIDDDITLLQLRHMLGTVDVPHAIGAPGNEEAAMGDYFPRGRCVKKSAVETALPFRKCKAIRDFSK